MIPRTLPAWDRPVLASVAPVVATSDLVRTDEGAVGRVAEWMAYESFPAPHGGPAGPFDWGDDPDRLIDATMVKTSLDFAFTDFSSGRKFEVEHLGRRWSDSEAMFACLHRAMAAGTPILEGEWMAAVTADELAGIFAGSIAMPMLGERAAVLNEVGRHLVETHGGHFHRFVRGCPPQLYAGGAGLLERLTAEFPRFADQSPYRGGRVTFHKLAQLALWSLHLAVGERGGFALRDLGAMTAFADYIVPVALRVMGILVYHPDLEQAIESGEEVRRDSPAEVEIRAHSLHATALLTEAVNLRRPADRALVIPQIDYRLWSAYHATHHRHHLTRTVMY